MAGPATMHQRIANQYGVSDDLPCADAALLIPLKRSALYGSVRKRVAHLQPVDSWEEDALHFFVFELKPEVDAPAAAEPPIAVFAMDPGSTDPVSAVVVTPGPDGQQAEVRDLREPANTYFAFLPTESSTVPGTDRGAASRPDGDASLPPGTIIPIGGAPGTDATTYPPDGPGSIIPITGIMEAMGPAVIDAEIDDSSQPNTGATATPQSVDIPLAGPNLASDGLADTSGPIGSMSANDAESTAINPTDIALFHRIKQKIGHLGRRASG